MEYLTPQSAVSIHQGQLHELQVEPQGKPPVTQGYGFLNFFFLCLTTSPIVVHVYVDRNHTTFDAIGSQTGPSPFHASCVNLVTNHEDSW